MSVLQILLYTSYKNNPNVYIDVHGDYIAPIIVLLLSLLGLNSCSNDEKENNKKEIDITSKIMNFESKYCLGYALPVRKDMLGKSIDEIILDISSAIHLWIADEIEKIIMKSLVNTVVKVIGTNSAMLSFNGYLIYSCKCPTNKELNFVTHYKPSNIYEYFGFSETGGIAGFRKDMMNYFMTESMNFQIKCESCEC